jgi:hypothetical protein
MAYAPSKEIQALLEKQRMAYRTGWRPNAQEQSLLSEHSKRMVEDMAPKVNTGGGGPYDYGSGTTGGYGYGMDQPFSNYVEPSDAVKTIQQKNGSGQPLTNSEQQQLNDYMTKLEQARGLAQLNPNEVAERYQNFLNTEKQRRSQGLPPSPLPAQFTSIARTNNPLGYNLADQSAYQKPVVNSQGGQDLIKAGLMNAQGIVAPIKSQPVIPSTPYSQPNIGPGGSPTLAPNPGNGSNPTPVNANPTATLPFNPADALPSAPVTVRTPNGGLALGNTTAGIDEGKLLAEAEMQKQLRQQTYEQQVAGRKSMLDELSGVLQKQQAGMMSDQMPGIYEDLNTRGLLRSSALGEKVGLEQSKLARQTSEQLALQGITDRNSAINDLGSIEDSYLSGRGAAMSRRFSLEDFDRQVAAGEKLGANALPQISQPSGKGSGALQGALGGGSIGASVGGPTGAVIGGLAGAIGGGKLGGK